MSELIAVPNIEVLIDRVRTAHREAQAHADKAREYESRAIDRALEAGDLLLLLKPTVKHGEWGSFLAERLPEISLRQAQNYMKVARELPAEKRSDSFLTIRGALRMLESPDDDSAMPDQDDGEDQPTTIDRHYRVFMDKKSDVLNAEMDSILACESLSVGAWIDAFKNVKDDKQGLRDCAINVVSQPATNRRDVLSKLATLTIMLDGNELPICNAWSALFACGDYDQSIVYLNKCIDVYPKGVNAFIEIRAEIDRHFAGSVQVPF